jgi:hypothetical protein
MVVQHRTSAVLCSLRARSGRHLLLFMVSMALLGLVAGCEGGPPGPTAVPAKISGHVYQRPSAEFGEPMLSDVLITIERADGSQCITRTDAAGFYTASVARGIVSISAAKGGYQTSRSHFELATDTVLNFSLVPDVS